MHVKPYRQRRKGQRDIEFLVEAIDDLSKNLGKWLAAVALAASTPSDNSDEIKALTAKLKESTDSLEAAVQSQTPDNTGG